MIARKIACSLSALIAFTFGNNAQAQKKPAFVKAPILHTAYDGDTDDLLTAGLGKTGLQTNTPPAFADPLKPTAAELRRRAIYNNYRALVDISSDGGYGVLYGPNIDRHGNPTLAEGKIAGDEYLAYVDNLPGTDNVTMMVQIPANFDPANPCIVSATSSGSRGIYGAIATAGEWGLKRGCVVAYTDKGTGNGAHDLQENSVNLIRGERANATVAGKRSNFTAPISDVQRSAYLTGNPHRFAFKHAHSQRNPEMSWGLHTLQAIKFAFYVLNQKNIGVFTPKNTLVIASSVSNGGGAALRALEQDTEGLIDGVAVSEPNVQPSPSTGAFSIVQEGRAPLTNHSKSLLDYITLVNLYQPCAALAPANGGAPLNGVPSPLAGNRCASLREKNLLSSDTLEQQAVEAQKIINDYGILPEQNLAQPAHYFLSVPQGIAVTYANAYGRFDLTDNLCGYSFAAADPSANPIPLPAINEAALYGDANGIPPTGGINLINNLSVDGPKEDRISTSSTTQRQDLNIDGAICLRNLALGRDIVTGLPLTGSLQVRYQRIKAGIAQVRASARLRGRPVIIVTGRADAVIAPNHAARPYYALNKLRDGANSKTRYYEITNAQHLDTLNGVPGFNSRFVPLHHYFNQAMNLLYDHLTQDKPLPPSQVVRTVPRGNVGNSVPPISPANVPPIADTPAADAEIRFIGNQLHIPN
ncbi:MAG: D-(-)-3-hydroxybutyrate oligomer hydrolase [Gammaproteobacteria bacterium]|nr:D-(-)-3-hydroxybutyrate oligomer hydrolase [Gammaproteobacteria bacterium]